MLIHCSFILAVFFLFHHGQNCLMSKIMGVYLQIMCAVGKVKIPSLLLLYHFCRMNTLCLHVSSIETLYDVNFAEIFCLPQYPQLNQHQFLCYESSHPSLSQSAIAVNCSGALLAIFKYTAMFMVTSVTGYPTWLLLLAALRMVRVNNANWTSSINKIMFNALQM